METSHSLGLYPSSHGLAPNLFLKEIYKFPNHNSLQVWLIFSLIYWSLGGTNNDGDNFIYPVLKYCGML